ncbi:MAG: DEAD/DEAH box helicase [Nitrospinota bacterium]|nr:DEAD/DEAH box helicase [Nitrospinota bacterium]
MPPGGISDLLANLKAEKGLGQNVKAERIIPPAPAEYADFPGALHPSVVERFREKGVQRLYSHQAKAMELAMEGKNVIVSTPTASGKTACYMAPVMSDFMNDPEATAIFIFPLKALERDQLGAWREFGDGLPGDLRVEVFDGDTPQYQRGKIAKNPPRAIFTNPDMLHLSILPYHGKWEGFLRRLKYVVVDEAHTYRGVFGSHVAQIFRRLRRVCASLGSTPQFLASSATISNPAQFAQTLTGAPFELVDRSGAPKPGGVFVIYDTNTSPYADASRIFRLAVREGFKTIAFTKARKITELIYAWSVQAEPDMADRISCYRAGFLPEERRSIEQDLFGGKLDGVVTTSALEMGVDIGGLDVCLLVGYPGAIVNTWQRAGRVGRADREFMIVLIAQPDALDQYFVRRPEELFTRGFEAAVVDPENRPILKSHIACAAAELALDRNDPWLGEGGREDAFADLERERRLVRSADGARWLSPRRYPHRDTPIRSVGDSYTIFLQGGKTVIGVISGSRVYGECHPGAVYLHMGRQYLITSLDMEKRAAHARPMDEKYYTRPRSQKETEILETIKSREVNGFHIRLGKLKVTEQVTGYERRSIFGQEALGVYDLQCPRTEFETVGFWVEIEDPVKLAIEEAKLGYMGGIHAFEHGVISLFPLFALCDRDDIGGISYPLYPGLGKSAVFFYDGYPGGLGLCEAGFDRVEKMWGAALDLIAGCECETGCPSCIHSPKCGSGNKPLDKMAARTLLEYLCAKTPYPGETEIRHRKSEPASPSIISKPNSPAPMQDGPPLAEEKEDAEYYDPAPEKRILFFDLETLRSAAEVGGWNNTHKMGMSVGVVYDSREKKATRYFEQETDAMVEKLLAADLVVGFNHIGFDYGVLAGYTKINLRATAPSFDILLDVKERLGHRLSLDHLAQATLGKGKTADGLQALAWWKEGLYDKVADYCEADVMVTKKLFEFGLENGHMLYTLKDGQTARITLDWDLDAIIKAAAETVAKPKPRRIRF